MGQNNQKSAKIYSDPLQKCEFYSKQHKKRQFTSGVSQDIGGRPYQEDRYIMIDDLQSSQSQYVTIPSALYVVLDGHGGYQCAEYVKANFVNIFVQTDAFQSMDYPAAFRSTYKELETTWNEQASLYKMEGWSSGTCVLACLVVSEGIYVSWVGDCRMTGYSDLDMKHVQRITVDQKPTAPKELSRILKAGAKVKHIKIPGGCFRNSKGPDRVYPGGLAVARSIGTIKCKQSKYGAVDGAIVGYPEVRYINVDEFQGVRWLIMGSDGLWDYYPNSRMLSKLMCSKLYYNIDAKDMSKYIMKSIRTSSKLRFHGGSPDNATILVVKIRLKGDEYH